ncbi:alpha/beta fold hydrolase [Ramlibacter rhizophilus]|uniref:Alpha/beta hydrolase n=1 Tax=Ramlibacter rhizophilus TaxID=1781167 RepID=A0A4Z0BID6_9BURK|nr:alpha/beta hydrolase [Ramlibacter rhizophilus]TFY98027.1 alpha/beta hydrolase [Ramlibacter rhizophilus]
MSLPTFSTLGDGPTVLMLHGVAATHLAFAPQVESLAMAGFRAVAWDMPGYGLSPPIEPYTFKGLAERCIALIGALRCTTVTLLGHDMGGMVAQEVVARRPELVDRLVLCGTSPSFTQLEAELVPDAAHTLRQGRSMGELAEALVPQMVGSGSLPEGVRLAQHCMGQVHPSTFRRALDALPTFDRTSGLDHIHVPTLLVAGEQDRHAPPHVMRQMSRRIASSTYIEMPGIGHLPNLEAPDEFDAAVLNFLALPRLLH